MKRNIFIWTAVMAMSITLSLAQNNDPWGDDAYGLRNRKNKSALSQDSRKRKEKPTQNEDWYFKEDPYMQQQADYPPVSDAELDAYNRRGAAPDSLNNRRLNDNRRQNKTRTIDGYYTQRLSRFYDHDIAVRNVDEVNIYLNRFSPYGYEQGYYDDGSTFANIYVNNRGGYYYDDPMMYDPFYANTYLPWYTVPPYGGYWGYCGYYPYPSRYGWSGWWNWYGGYGGWYIGWNGPYWGFGWGSYYGWPGYWGGWPGYGWGYYDGYYAGYNSYRYDNYRHGSYSNGYYGRSNYGNGIRSTYANRNSNSYSRSRYDQSAQGRGNSGSYDRSAYNSGSRSEATTISRPPKTVIDRYERSNGGMFGSPSRSNSDRNSRYNNSYNRGNNNNSYNRGNFERSNTPSRSIEPSKKNNSNNTYTPSRSTYNSNSYSTPSRSTYNSGGGSYSRPSRSSGGSGGGSSYRRR